MNSFVSRPYRKKLSTLGLMYLAGKEQEFNIKNISISGILAQIVCDASTKDSKGIVYALSTTAMIDLYVPEMRLAGEAIITRVNLYKNEILFGLEFKTISCDINANLYQRKAYRKKIDGKGFILLNGDYMEFAAVNISVDGLMVRLSQFAMVEPGTVTIYELNDMNLSGEVKVIWVDHIAGGGTAMGLKFIKNKGSKLPRGLPNFDLSQKFISY